MHEHLAAKLLIVASAGAGLIVGDLPASDLLSSDQVEAWARFGVAGGCLLILLAGLFYTIPRIMKDHRQSLNEAHASHERTVDRICVGHENGLQAMRIGQNEDSVALGENLDRLAESIEAMRKDNAAEGLLQRSLLQQQVTQLKEIKSNG